MLQQFWHNIRRTKRDFSQEEGHTLHRVLGVRDLTMLGIAAIIGGGIFSSVGKACASGGPGVILLFILCAIACGFAAMCYAEFSSRIPVAGSAYTYAYASFGELFAWIIGWALLMEYSIGNIYVAFSWSGYFTHLMENLGIHMPAWITTDYASCSAAAKLPNPILQSREMLAWKGAPVFMGMRIILDLPALLINILITWLVFTGVKESRNASNIMVAVKLIVIILVIGVGFFYVDTPNFKPFMPEGFGGVMAGVSAVFFTFIGFDAVSTMAEETKDPQRNLPRGMFYSLLVCTVLYILISLVLTGMMPYKLLGVDDPLATVLQFKGIVWLEYLVSVSAVVAMASVLLVFQMGQPRIWMSMSRDGLLPQKFSEVHPKYKTPAFSTVITGLVVGIPILFTDENFVLDFTSIGTLFAFVLVCGGVLILPRKEKEIGAFQIPFVKPFYFPLIMLLVQGLILYLSPQFFFEQFHNPVMIGYWSLMVLLAILSLVKDWNLIPVLGLATCGYLLTGMTANNWFWFFVWFGIGLLVYFAYGYKKSKLARG
jgi:basic amino acid/polyamine antiporter, APA family